MHNATYCYLNNRWQVQRVIDQAHKYMGRCTIKTRHVRKQFHNLFAGTVNFIKRMKRLLWSPAAPVIFITGWDVLRVDGCKTAVIPLLAHWSYCSLPLSRRCDLSNHIVQDYCIGADNAREVILRDYSNFFRKHVRGVCFFTRGAL